MQKNKDKCIAQTNLPRCAWCTDNPIYQAYHDDEWGVPNYADTHLFEMLVLEGAQAGLSWLTILKRREAYRQAFAHFDVKQVANFQAKDIQRLLTNKGIIRNRLKIQSALTNARVFLQIQQEFGSFSQYLWSYVKHQPIINHYKNAAELPATSDLAKHISEDLKRRGMSFVGPTIMYAYLQAVGVVNDHTQDCFKYVSAKKLC